MGRYITQSNRLLKPLLTDLYIFDYDKIEWSLYCFPCALKIVIFSYVWGSYLILFFQPSDLYDGY